MFNYCIFCSSKIINVFNQDLIIQKCYPCNLIQMDFKNFGIYLKNTCNNLKYSNIDTNLILNYFSDFLISHKFGDIKSRYKCSANCITNSQNCSLMMYEFEKFPFYFCFYNNIIYFNEIKFQKLVKSVKRKLFWKSLKFKFKKLLKHLF